MFKGITYWLSIAEYAPVFLWIMGYWWWARSKQPLPMQSSIADATS
jgi:hypothetical protein